MIVNANREEQIAGMDRWFLNTPVVDTIILNVSTSTARCGGPADGPPVIFTTREVEE